MGNQIHFRKYIWLSVINQAFIWNVRKNKFKKAENLIVWKDSNKLENEIISQKTKVVNFLGKISTS